MTTQMAKQEPGERMTLAQVQEITGYTLPEIALVRATVAKDAGSIVDLALFLHGAKRLGLDPLQKQIYWIVRQGKGGIQVGIDGFRSLAARTKEYAGSEAPIFRGVIEIEDGDRMIEVPEMATVVVWRMVQGHKCAFTGEARWREFYPGAGAQGFMWRKMPHGQLGKCAEAQALRKGFPAELGGTTLATGEDDAPQVEVTEMPQEPARRRYTADDYTRIHGSDDDGTAFADQPPAPAQDASLVTTKRDPRWHAFTAAAAQAEAEHIDVPDIKLPIPAAELADATETLTQMVAEKRGAVVGA